MKIEKIVIKLIRKKLGLKEYEKFRFTNQKTNDIYYFNERKLMKTVSTGYGIVLESGVSLNWLLDPDCKIVKLGE